MILPDVVRPGLRVVFCGTAAGAASARHGAYYAGPGNRFWPTLHATGLTPRRLAPAEFATVVEHGIGLTDLCKTRSGSDAQIGTGGFDRARLADCIAASAPGLIAFNGLRAARGALGPVDGYGPHAASFAGAAAWVLPSTSGAAIRWWDPEPWQRLAAALGPAPDRA
jgi:TDG/mug DNA glycosylase family protein